MYFICSELLIVAQESSKYEKYAVFFFFFFFWGGGGGGGTASVFWLKDRKTLSAGYMCSCDKSEVEYI